MPEYRQHEETLWALEPYYCRHVEAMTVEGLHAKSDIAAELAVRDKTIAALRARVAELERARGYSGSIDQLRDVIDEACGTQPVMGDEEAILFIGRQLDGVVERASIAEAWSARWKALARMMRHAPADPDDLVVDECDGCGDFEPVAAETSERVYRGKLDVRTYAYNDQDDEAAEGEVMDGTLGEEDLVPLLYELDGDEVELRVISPGPPRKDG